MLASRTVRRIAMVVSGFMRLGLLLVSGVLLEVVELGLRLNDVGFSQVEYAVDHPVGRFKRLTMLLQPGERLFAEADDLAVACLFHCCLIARSKSARA